MDPQKCLIWFESSKHIPIGAEMCFDYGDSFVIDAKKDEDIVEGTASALPKQVAFKTCSADAAPTAEDLIHARKGSAAEELWPCI